MKTLTLTDLAIAFIPVVVTLIVITFWSNSLRQAMIGMLRMLVQLLLIGYVLNFIFTSSNHWIVLAVLCFMLLAASWISLDSIPVARSSLIAFSLAAISIGGIFNLLLVSQFVVDAQPWYEPAVLIPLAGMIFANSMNAVSLAGERLFSEIKHDEPYQRARNTAYQAALIPNINALMAVGLVSLPGMMTGQILAGTSPLIAARYQIVVMCMIFSASGISAAVFLWLIKSKINTLGKKKAG